MFGFPQNLWWLNTRSSFFQYKNPDVAKRDVLNALTHFGDLRPKPDDFGMLCLFVLSL